MKFFKKYLKFFVLAFALGFLAPYAKPELFSADTINADNYYETNYSSLEDAIVAYHLKTNEITNQYLSMLMNEEAATYGYVEMPPSDENCTGDNVSTYCLAVALNKNLVDFEKYVASKKSALDMSDDTFSGGKTFDESVDNIYEQTITLDDQLAIAGDSLDLTLAVYNQIQIIFPVHKELTDLIKNMTAYRDNLAKVRSIIELYPGKFNGATTAQCK
jgi:hypothetical protein